MTQPKQPEPEPIEVEFTITGSFTYYPLPGEDLSELPNGVIHRPGYPEINLGLGSSYGFSEAELREVGIDDLEYADEPYDFFTFEKARPSKEEEETYPLPISLTFKYFKDTGTAYLVILDLPSSHSREVLTNTVLDYYWYDSETHPGRELISGIEIQHFTSFSKFGDLENTLIKEGLPKTNADEVTRILEFHLKDLLEFQS